MDFSKIQLEDSSPSPSLRLKKAFDACSKSFKIGDFRKSDEAISAVVDFLDSIIEPSPSDSEDAVSKNASKEALFEIHCYLSSPSSDQMVVGALTLVLPKVVMKFAGVSDECRQIGETIMDCLISICSPRDMLSVLCEALDSHIQFSKAPFYYIPILSGLSKVFLSIQRRHIEQVKVALPVILNVLSSVSLEADEEDKGSLIDLFGGAICIGTSIQAVCEKLVGRKKEELRAILALYTLQNMALISRSNLANDILSCSSLVLKFSQFIPFCGLSYIGLISGGDVSAITALVSEEDSEEFMANFSFVTNGASLAVVWGFISDEIERAAGEQLVTVLNEMRSNHTKRWQAIGMLRYALSPSDYPWELEIHSIEFLLSMMDGGVSEESTNDHMDCASFMPSLFASLQAVERIMIGAPDASVRCKAFAALRKVVSDLPSSQRFDMLKGLIIHSTSPSMIAILIDLVKKEILVENHRKSSNDEINQVQNRTAFSLFWSSAALDLVDLVLKPPKGGPPSLPEHSEPVLSALNLYRLILIIESTGNTNHTGVLLENNLRKAYAEWLLPLRTLVAGIRAENEKDISEFADAILCALNPVESVLYRCIELVEDNLKHSK